MKFTVVVYVRPPGLRRNVLVAIDHRFRSAGALHSSPNKYKRFTQKEKKRLFRLGSVLSWKSRAYNRLPDML